MSDQLDNTPGQSSCRDNKQSIAHMNARLHFLGQIFAAIQSSHANPHMVYPLLKNHLDQLDYNLMHVLQVLVTDRLSKVDMDQAQVIASDIIALSDLLQQFPVGRRDTNIEIAITGYELALQVYTQEFPQQWGTILFHLGSGYCLR
jgi:hypothetical protein